MSKGKLMWIVLSACVHESPPPVVIVQQVVEAPPADGTGVVRGAVTDREGNGLANARVELRGGAQPFATQTDGNGGYRLRDVPAGTYTLWIGVGPGAQRSIEAQAGRESVINIRLDAI